MTGPAPVIAPAARLRDKITSPERWETWVPNKVTFLHAHLQKGGTTWTQTILAMLVHGGADLPMKQPVLSPWVNSYLGTPACEVAAALAAQTGWRVVKTHTHQRFPGVAGHDGYCRLSSSAGRLLFSSKAHRKPGKSRRR